MFFKRDSYGRAGESQNRSRGRSRSRGRANFQPRVGSNSYCSICKRTSHETRIVSSSAPEIPLILTETTGTETRQMVVERTMQQFFQTKKINYSIPA